MQRIRASTAISCSSLTRWHSPGSIRSVTRIGDALAPGAIVHAVYSGHRYARELDTDPTARRYRRDAPLPRAV